MVCLARQTKKEILPFPLFQTFLCRKVFPSLPEAYVPSRTPSVPLKPVMDADSMAPIVNPKPGTTA